MTATTSAPSADPADADPVPGWAEEHRERLHPASAGSTYLDLVSDEGTDRVRAGGRA